jgi:hypothetical protein
MDNTPISLRPMTPVFLLLLLGGVPSRADAQWLEAKTAHYPVLYQAGYEKDAEFTRKWLDATQELMKVKYGSTPDRYYMSIYLLSTPTGDIDTAQSGQNQCCTPTITGEGTGTIRLLTRSAPVWKSADLTSSLGLPKTGD